MLPCSDVDAYNYSGTRLSDFDARVQNNVDKQYGT
jgi:hypothetical protein